jgi:anti-sigma factor RsiW
MNMEKEHLNASHLTRLRRGELLPDEVIAVSTHLATCESCRDLGSGESAAHERAVVDGLLRDSAGDHPDADLLMTFADGKLPFDEHERVDAHLGICERCRAEVDDDRDAAASLRPLRLFRTRRKTLLAVAATVVAMLTMFLLFREAARRPGALPPSPIIRSTPPTAPEPIEAPLKAEWQAVVAEALNRGDLPMPSELREIQGSTETVRGTAEHHADVVSPAGNVVETDRPEFAWPARKDMTATVFVYDGEEQIAVSDAVHGSTWRPSKPLPRGVPLVWQVEVRGAGGSTRVIPSPPDPPAMFRILDAASQRGIDEVLRLEPRNDLLLGILYARAGVKERAVEALRRHAEKHPDAKPLLQSVQSWP